MAPNEIEKEFPNLKSVPWSSTSVETDEYNCIAYAGHDTTRKWDPDASGERYWPAGVPRTLDLSSFIRLYELEGGYSICNDNNSRLEEGIEKIAIYCNKNPILNTVEVSHAARQLPTGKWTSKLGDWDDIEHDSLSALEGDFYGRVAQILKRTKR
jgi:hypothetical protein